MTNDGYCHALGSAHRVRNCPLEACATLAMCCAPRNQTEAPPTTPPNGGSLASKPLYAETQTPNPEPTAMITGTSAERKAVPICTGVLDYFPLALAAVARLSKFGNDKHNPGQPLHWSRQKSSDHADCVVRHLIDRGVTDQETGMSHTVEVAWRALALLEEEEERRLNLPLSRGSR